MVRVKNVEGHFKDPEGYESWIEYWEDKMGRDAEECSRYFCSNKDDIVGALVTKVPDDGNIYLIPLCRSHNTHVFVNPFNVPNNVLYLVPEEDLVVEE